MRAAEQGYPAAQFTLAGLYGEGKGIERSDALASVMAASGRRTGLWPSLFCQGAFACRCRQPR